MAVREEYLAYIIDQLSEFGSVDSKKMFGGIGLFRQNLMFGMIGGEVFRLKVDEQNQKEYEERGMTQFPAGKKKKGMPYWEVPSEVLEDKAELAKWATKSFEAAQRAKK